MRRRAFVQLAAVVFAVSMVPLISGCSDEATTSPEGPSLQDTSPPAPPVGLSFEGRETGFVLRWSPNTEPDLVGYNLYIYDPTPDRPESYVKCNQQLLTGNEFRRSKLTPNRQMIYRLTALDESGNESGFSSLIIASTSAVQLKEQ